MGQGRGGLRRSLRARREAFGRRSFEGRNHNSRGLGMRLSVFGLGYVGCVSAACFAKEGHEVTGVDVNPVKVEIINSGRTPIVEAGIGELIQEMVEAGRLRATTDSAEAVAASDLSL